MTSDMNLRELQRALSIGVTGQKAELDAPVEIIDSDAFVHEIVTAEWDDEGQRFLLRTRYVGAEIIIVEPENT